MVFLPLRKVFYGWWIVAVGVLITAVGSVYSYGFTVFFLPLSEELNLSRASTSLVFSMARLEGGLEGPAAGWLIDRLGSRIVIFIGAVMAGTGFLILATIHSFWGLVLVYLGFISIGFHMGFFQALVPAANMWFSRQRTLAISIISSGSRIGAAVIVPLLAFIVFKFGWRMGAAATGIMLLMVVLPLSFVLRRSPESMGLHPDGAPAAEVEPGPAGGARRTLSSTARKDYEVVEAMRTPTFWVIAIAHSLRVAAFTGMLVHLVPLFVWKGMSQQTGAGMVGLLALVGFPSTLLIGWMADRMSKQAIMAVGAASKALAMVTLFYTQGLWPSYLAIAFMALGDSVGSVNWSLVGDMFGRKRFATIRGIMSAISTMGVGMPVLVGWLYDTSQSYSLALLLLGSCSAAATVLYVLLFRMGRRQVVEIARPVA